MRSIGAAMRAPRPGPSLLDFTAYVEGWRRLHAGYDVANGSAWVRGWLRLQYRLARPLAVAGVSPSAVTGLTALLAAGAAAGAALGGRWPLLGALLVVLSGVGDGLDGAVAVLSHRATAWGYVLDSLVDRINELLLIAALVAVGGAPLVAVHCAVLVFLLEYLRARAGNAGHGEITAITVAERPNRVIGVALGLAGAGVSPALAAQVATAALGLLAALSAIGLVQLVIAARRQLSHPPPGRT